MLQQTRIHPWLTPVHEMWQRKTSRRFGLGIHPNVSLEEAQNFLNDHDLIADLIYGTKNVQRVDTEGTQGTTNYKVANGGSSVRVRFERQGEQLVAYEKLELGTSFLIHWRIIPSSAPGETMLLMEDNELQMPRLVSFLLAINVVQSVSGKTQLMAAAMEIRHRKPNLSKEDLIRETRRMVSGIDLASQTHDLDVKSHYYP